MVGSDDGLTISPLLPVEFHGNLDLSIILCCPHNSLPDSLPFAFHCASDGGFYGWPVDYDHVMVLKIKFRDF